MPRLNHSFHDRHEQILRQLREQTGTSASEWLRRMVDYCVAQNAINEMVPCLSGQIVISVQG